ncbi:MAG TPA: response regulator, partial [Candidatus Binataceae bacterium]|nr:response regulator [Candidatus Binataceae bacterium]
AIVDRLVTLMGGQVHAESAPGKGSVFSFTVQLDLPQGQSNAQRSLADPKLNGVSVLLADDSAITRSIARTMLEARGARVTDADSAATALREFDDAIARGTPFGLLVLDSGMPDMDAAQMLERIAQSTQPKTPIIVMMNSTGLATKLAPAKGLGRMDYLIKPLKQRELYAKAHEVLTDAPQEPAASSRFPNAAAITNSRDVIARPLRVLLADDSPDNRLLIRAYLKKTPYSLDEAENGQLAYQRFIAGDYDLVLMDIQMPVLDGYTAVRMIRDFEKDHQRKRTPIIALTASALDDAVRRAKDAGCDLHVSKPVKKVTLLEAIANSIEAAEAVMN